MPRIITRQADRSRITSGLATAFAAKGRPLRWPSCWKTPLTAARASDSTGPQTTGTPVPYRPTTTASFQPPFCRIKTAALDAYRRPELCLSGGARGYQAGFVGEDHELGAVAGVEL